MYICKGRARTLTEEHKNNIRKAMLGHHLSEETN